jgi:hypothetical protein
LETTTTTETFGRSGRELLNGSLPSPGEAIWLWLPRSRGKRSPQWRAPRRTVRN